MCIYIHICVCTYVYIYIYVSPEASPHGTPFFFIRGAPKLLREALPLYSLASYDLRANPRRVMTLSQHRWLVLGRHCGLKKPGQVA